MPIQFRCNTCRKLLSVARRKAGQETECPVCGSKTRVPQDVPEEASSPGVLLQTAPAGDQSKPAPAFIPPLTAANAAPAPTIPTPAVSEKGAPGTSQIPQPVPSQPAAPKSATGQTKKLPGSSGILEIDPDRLLGKSGVKSHGSELKSSPARELSDYFEAIDRSHPEDGSGSQAVEVPEPFLPQSSSWKLQVFGGVLILALASALVVGFLLLKG